MKREILFRGKRIDNGKWIYGLLHKNVYGAYEIQDTDSLNTSYPVEEESIGQWTGFFDKEKKKIFEGDIIYYVWDTFGHIILMEAAFKNGEFCFSPVKQYPFIVYSLRIPAMKSNVFDVIGNVYDNVELIKEDYNG